MTAISSTPPARSSTSSLRRTSATSPRTETGSPTVTLLCDLCAALGDGRRAALLYELLLPYAGVNVVAGIAVVCLGSAARYLGKLAATTGREREAVGHFERALEQNARLQAPVLLAHTQLDFAAALGGGGRASRLIDEAAATAVSLGLPWAALRARRLQED